MGTRLLMYHWKKKCTFLTCRRFKKMANIGLFTTSTGLVPKESLPICETKTFKTRQWCSKVHIPRILKLVLQQLQRKRRNYRERHEGEGRRLSAESDFAICNWNCMRSLYQVD